MNDLRALLREGDPVAREGELPLDEAARIRQQVRSAIVARQGTGYSLFAVITVAMMLLAAGGAWITQPNLPMSPGAEPTSGPPQRPGELTRTRQVQFVTAGGTRVFWTLHARSEGR